VEHKEVAKRYEKMLKFTKQQHWQDWLEKADNLNIWTIHRLIMAPASDGGKAQIPTLKHKVGNEDVMATTNSEKGSALVKGFFP